MQKTRLGSASRTSANTWALSAARGPRNWESGPTSQPRPPQHLWKSPVTSPGLALLICTVGHGCPLASLSALLGGGCLRACPATPPGDGVHLPCQPGRRNSCPSRSTYCASGRHIYCVLSSAMTSKGELLVTGGDRAQQVCRSDSHLPDRVPGAHDSNPGPSDPDLGSLAASLEATTFPSL